MTIERFFNQAPQVGQPTVHFFEEKIMHKLILAIVAALLVGAVALFALNRTSHAPEKGATETASLAINGQGRIDASTIRPSTGRRRNRFNGRRNRGGDPRADTGTRRPDTPRANTAARTWTRRFISVKADWRWTRFPSRDS